MKELKYEKSFASTEAVETEDRISVSMKNPDTMVSMIVLLITCLALAGLVHVFIS